MNNEELLLLEALSNESEFLTEPEIKNKYLVDHKYRNVRKQLGSLIVELKKEGLLTYRQAKNTYELNGYKISEKGISQYCADKAIKDIEATNSNLNIRKLKLDLRTWWISPAIAILALIVAVVALFDARNSKQKVNKLEIKLKLQATGSNLSTHRNTSLKKGTSQTLPSQDTSSTGTE